MRRRRLAIASHEVWARSLGGRITGAQSVQALMTPRIDRVIDLLELRPGRRYADFGCGTWPYAHFVASRARLEAPPVTFDLSVGDGVDAIAWPERLPLADASIDAFSSLGFLHRFEDDVVRAFGDEVARVLAPGGCALFIDYSPVRARWLDRFHGRLLAPGAAQVDLRGWGRLAALLTECGFDQLDLVSAGPFFLPPIPRVGVLARKAASREGEGA
jgi:SAM-dependent methyltransferase